MVGAEASQKNRNFRRVFFFVFLDGKSLDDGFDFFLKKDISSLLRLGVVIAPHEAYIDELVTMHYMRNRKPKARPDVIGDTLDGLKLSEEEKCCFRSRMRTLLYISQDRIDIQHAVRNLSQWMLMPTRRTMDGVRHVIPYLTGT